MDVSSLHSVADGAGRLLVEAPLHGATADGQARGDHGRGDLVDAPQERGHLVANLVGDLAAGDFLDVHLPRQADGPPPAEILERLLEGLRGR